MLDAALRLAKGYYWLVAEVHLFPGPVKYYGLCCCGGKRLWGKRSGVSEVLMNIYQIIVNG